mmetsp:Transcript_2690/g.3216  ORF Transcript_2690/g.3216 Transcript_2690/m.3216 type:complete len:265 (-) Transcript_2690:666-1460(-)
MPKNSRPLPVKSRRASLVIQDLAQEILCPFAFGVSEELLSSAVLNNLAGVHEHHPVRNLAGKAHLVGHNHHRHAVLRQFDHHIQHLVDHLRVKGRCRLVKQHRNRVHGQRPADRHPLLLAARQLAGKLLDMRQQADPADQGLGLGVGFVARPTQDLLLAQAQVFTHAHMRVELKMLEHHADPRPQFCQIGAVGGDLHVLDPDAALLNRLQPVHAFDQGRLAGTGRPADHYDFPLGDMGGAIGQHLEVAVAFGNVFDADHAVLAF